MSNLKISPHCFCYIHRCVVQLISSFDRHLYLVMAFASSYHHIGFVKWNLFNLFYERADINYDKHQKINYSGFFFQKKHWHLSNDLLCSENVCLCSPDIYVTCLYMNWWYAVSLCLNAMQCTSVFIARYRNIFQPWCLWIESPLFIFYINHAVVNFWLILPSCTDRSR